MKYFLIPIFTLVAFLSNAQTNKTSNRSIFDYYLLLPSSYFMCDATIETDTKESRTKAIKTLDLKNGYILAEPMNYYDLQVVLFKDQKTKKDLIVVAINCGPGCMCNTKEFLIFNENDKSWSENHEVLTEKIDGAYVLPKNGTIIKVYDFETFETKISGSITGEKNKLIYELQWLNGEFKVIKK